LTNQSSWDEKFILSIVEGSPSPSTALNAVIGAFNAPPSLH